MPMCDGQYMIGAVRHVYRVPSWPVLAFAILIPCSLHAQDRKAILVVSVRDQDSIPIAQASLRIVSEDGRFTRTGSTDGGGRFRFILSPPDTAYLLSIHRLGYYPVTQAVIYGQKDSAVARTVRLRVTADVLERVRIRARPLFPPTQQDPSATHVPTTAIEALKLPLDAGNFGDIVALTPGVSSGAAAGNAPSIAINGQPASQTALTLDGATYGDASVPQEALRTISVTTSGYDVSRGQFSGGLVAATTRRGTGTWNAAASIDDSPSIFSLDAPGWAGGQRPASSRQQGSIGIGGPLIPNKLFVYGAADVRRSDTPLPTLLGLDSDGLQRIGVAPDSVHRLQEVLKALMVPGFDFRTSDEFRSRGSSGIMRLDYNLAEDQAVTLRLNGRSSRLSNLGLYSLSTPSTARTRSSGANGLFVQWARTPMDGATNTAHLYSATSYDRTAPNLRAPQGFVSVTSAPSIASSATSAAGGDAILGFGGGTQSVSSTLGTFEIADDFTKSTSNLSRAVHVGAILTRQRASISGTVNSLGTFTFPTLNDLADGQASSYTRTLPSRGQWAQSTTLGAYLGGIWRVASETHVTLGARAERTSYQVARQLAPEVATLTKLGAGIPSEFRVSPRAGFDGEVLRAGKWDFNGGIGEFRGTIPIRTVAEAGIEDGRSSTSLDCIASAVPTPRWNDYGTDINSIPTACTGQSEMQTIASPVTVFGDSFGAPRTLHGSLRLQWSPVSSAGAVSVEGHFLNGSHQPFAVNLNQGPQHFTIWNEGNRAVFVPLDAFDPTTGLALPSTSRINPALGQVREITSAGRSSTRIITASWFKAFQPRGHVSLAQLNYTYTRARVMANGVEVPGGPSAYAGGDASDASWVTSDNEQRHVFLAFLTSQVTPWLNVSLTGRMMSGAFFTPLIAGDVNGDGVMNDRAFVFGSTGATDSSMASAMKRVLTYAPDRIKSCLSKQAGMLAAINSCQAPWSSFLNVQANIHPQRVKRLTVSLRLTNALAGLDYLAHGAKGVRGWGQFQIPDATLLRVTGFDPAKNQFKYQVNEHFGMPIATPITSPFGIQFRARVTFGSDPANQSLSSFIAASESGTSEESVRHLLTTRLVNAPAQALASNDTWQLALTAAQVIVLSPLADSLQAELDLVGDQLARALTAPKQIRDNADSRSLIHALATEGTRVIASGVGALRSVLSDTQWSHVPAAVRSPPNKLPDEPGRTIHVEGGVSG